MVGSASGPDSTFKVFLGSARVRVPLSNKIRVRVGSVQHIYGSLRVRVRIFGPVKTSTVKGGERLKDRFGIWTGKRRYLVKLRTDISSSSSSSSSPSGGLVHPPGSFFIGSNRGFLHYPGQPVYCRRCGVQGHVKADCTGQRCRFCGSAEHIASACPEPKTCSLCGERDHLFRVCPSRQKTYASLFKEGQGQQADFEGLLMSVPDRGESQVAGPSGVGAGGGAVRGQTAETRNGDVVEKGGGV